MPQRKTESRFLKRSGRRAGAVGVGGRSYSNEELLAAAGLSQRAIETFRNLSNSKLSSDDALRYAIQGADSKLYRQIMALGDETHSTFRSKLRLYCKQLKRG